VYPLLLLLVVVVVVVVVITAMVVPIKVPQAMLALPTVDMDKIKATPTAVVAVVAAVDKMGAQEAQPPAVTMAHFRAKAESAWYQQDPLRQLVPMEVLLPVLAEMATLPLGIMPNASF
jgi:hypothetical protein